MFANYPLAVQILGWGVFMGLNGYIGATCPGLNLAVLALMGMFASRKVGIVLLIAAIIITLVESAWYVVNMYATGMSSLGNAKTTFLQQGSGIINLLITGVVFFILLSKFNSALALPKWLSILVIVLFYVAGAWVGVAYWVPGASHLVLLVAVGLLMGLCYAPTVPFAIGIGILAFVTLFVVWSTERILWVRGQNKNKQEEQITAEFLQAAADNQQEKMMQLWNQVHPHVKTMALENALETTNSPVVDFLAPREDVSKDIISGALSQKDLKTIATLVKAGAPISPEHVELAIEYDFLPAIQLFVKNGVAINQKDYRSLSEGGEGAHKEIADFLKSAGAKV